MIGVGVGLWGTTALVSASWALFIPSGSDSLIDANGDTFKMREA